MYRHQHPGNLPIDGSTGRVQRAKLRTLVSTPSVICAYLGSGLQSVSLGYLVSQSWVWWPVFLTPFAFLGAFVAFRIWHELPAATRKYINDVESQKTPPVPAPELVR